MQKMIFPRSETIYLILFCIFATTMQEEARNMTVEEKAALVKQLSTQLLAEGRTDLLLKAISVPVLEQLRIEAARATLSPLVITKNYRFLLPDYGNKEVQLSPIHKALYLLFLNHSEGIEFKNLVDYREELLSLSTEKPATESTLKKSQKQCVA